jgi:hypothetical protein
MSVIPVLGRLRQENHEFKANLSYTMTRPCLKIKDRLGECGK